MDLPDVATSPGLRAALQAARAWGVPPSQFLGDLGPATVTEYVHDDAGRLVQSRTYGAPWTDGDRDLALQLAEWEADLCPGCRQPLAETTRPEHEYAYVVDHAHVVRCHRCTGQASAGAPYRDNPTPEALLVPVVLDPGRVEANLEQRRRWEEAERVHRGEAGAGGPGEAVAGAEGSA